MKPYRKLVALLLAVACSGDATAPDPAPVEPEPQPPAPPANRAPEAAGEIPAQRLVAGYAPEEVDASAYFTDPDGDALTFAASSADTAVVRVAVSGTALALEARAVGEAEVTVTASDPGGLSARAVFSVEATENPDRAALVAFYEATDGPNWANNENWLTDAPLADWSGVTVDNGGRVTELDLRDNGLFGPIPPELGNLASLEWLSLRDNDLTGPIPPELGNLASLRSLDLNENGLTGPIPAELGNLASLGTLAAGGNGLSGPIPAELGNLANLGTLNFGDNGLTGPIPPELGNLVNLGTLRLHYNGLSGPIPPELANLASLGRLDLEGNPDLCTPDDPRLRAWLIEQKTYKLACIYDVRLLPLALMRADGNGLSLPLPHDLYGSAVKVSDPGVVAATVEDDWQLALKPRSIGRADVELVPSGGGAPAVATVAVREAVGTFGIDIVMERPAPPSYEETMVAAADWWSSVLEGTEWEDHRPACYLHRAVALADELLIHAGSFDGTGLRHTLAWAAGCFWDSGEGEIVFHPGGGFIAVNRETPAPGDVEVIKHEIGHLLGLVAWPSHTGLTTEDEAHFTGSRAVEAYRAGGGDPALPGVPRDGWHWDGRLDELMRGRGGAYDGLSLAALADAGYTVDMTKATPWRASNAVAVAPFPLREIVRVRIVPRPVPE